MLSVSELSSPGSYFQHVTDNLYTNDLIFTTASPNNNLSYTSDAVVHSTPYSTPSVTSGGGGSGSFPNIYQGGRLPDGNFSSRGNSDNNISTGGQAGGNRSGDGPGSSGNPDDDDPNDPNSGR